jgi:hypothetical protein
MRRMAGALPGYDARGKGELVSIADAFGTPP